MREHTKQLDSFLNFILKPKFVLLSLTSLNFLAVPGRFGRLCFYNWKGALGFAFVLLIAAFALWLSKWWSYLVAVMLVAPVIYNFGYETLKVHRFLPLTPEEEEMWPSPAVWLDIFFWNHPEELVQIILAGLIFCYAMFCLWRYVFGKRTVLP
jgi:hypothetical protein